MNRIVRVLPTQIVSALLCLCVAGCAFSPVDDGAGKDLVVVVNGLEFARTIPAELAEVFGVSLSFPGDREDYLKPVLEAGLGSEFEVRCFGWSGNATQTGDILAAEGDPSLRAFLREACREARERDGKFIVVAHSWGSLLCYLALALESGGADPIDCDLYLSLSCPIAANHAGSIVDPLDFAVETYANAWMEELDFDIGGSRYPRADRFLNYWAWGDCISGPLGARIPAASGVEDRQIDIFGVADATSLKRGIDDVQFWHLFTSLRDETIAETGYAASEGFGEDLASLFGAFRAEILREIDRAGSDPHPESVAPRLRLTVVSVQCLDEPEWWGAGLSEYYGYFRIKRDGLTVAARKWYEDGDALSAWLGEGDTRNVLWSRDIAVPPGKAASVSLESVFFEDEVRGDGSPGRGSAVFNYDGAAWSLPAAAGFFDCAWRDGDDEYNVLRVNWSAGLVD